MGSIGTRTMDTIMEETGSSARKKPWTGWRASAIASSRAQNHFPAYRTRRAAQIRAVVTARMSPTRAGACQIRPAVRHPFAKPPSPRIIPNSVTGTLGSGEDNTSPA
jgi:hypothetical protein